MTVAHFFSFFRSHLAQVIVPLRVCALSSSARTATAMNMATTRPNAIDSFLMMGPPLWVDKKNGLWLTPVVEPFASFAYPRGSIAGWFPVGNNLPGESCLEPALFAVPALTPPRTDLQWFFCSPGLDSDGRRHSQSRRAYRGTRVHPHLSRSAHGHQVRRQRHGGRRRAPRHAARCRVHGNGWHAARVGSRRRQTD